jgi:integrase
MPKKRRSFGWVRKLPSGRYQASYPAPNGQRRKAPHTFATKTDAAKWLDQTRAGILEGRWRDPVLGKVRFLDYAERWITERPGLRPRTVDLYRWLLGRYLEPELGKIRLGDLNTLVVRRWRAGLLEQGVSETMVAKAYRLMRAILNTAVDDDILDRNPCRIRGGGDEKAPERPTLSITQVQQLAMLVPPRWSAFIAVKAFSSLRWGEMTALRRCDVDLEWGAVRVRRAYVELSDGSLELGDPKSAAGKRPVSLPAPVVEMLRAHLDTYVPNEPDALVFTGPSGRPMRRSNFNKAVRWHEACAAIGVPHLHLHDLRHTGNTLAAGTPGTSTRDLMERMGHSTMRAALIYQHATRDADRRIADALAFEIEHSGADASVTPLTARGQHEGDRRPNRRRGRRPRGPETGGSRVASGESAGVVQWQNISFPS